MSTVAVTERTIMSALNKLNRAFDSLKKINIKPTHEANRHKFRLTPCLTITELVCKSSEKTALLSFAITSLVQLLEDADSNTRLVIDESLNKIIRSSLDNSNHVAKILIALIKILGKSTNERSLRAALWRFAKLSHYIRPQKGKVYLKTLIPIFVKLATRKEESIHETLADSLPNIFQHVGLFTTDNDVRAMLKRFFRNLSSESVEIRRASASCIITVCELSRKPEFFFTHSIVLMIDFLFDCQILDDSSKLFVQGCLSCLRQILPSFIKFIRDPHSNSCHQQTEKLFQIYELCIFYAKFRDHNIITAALETLNQLLKHGHPAFVTKMVTNGGLVKSTIFKPEKYASTLSLSAHSDVLSIGSTIARTEDGFVFGESPPTPEDLPVKRSLSGSNLVLNEEPKEERTEKWISEQAESDSNSTSSFSLNMDASHFANSDDEISAKDDHELSYSSRAVSIDNIASLNDTEMSSMGGRNANKFRSLKSLPTTSIMSDSVYIDMRSTVLDIGDIVDGCDAPIVFCARFLVSMFLLEEPNEDGKRIRVSVMSLALTCVSQVLRINPDAALLTVEKSKPVHQNYNNLLEVILNQSTHEDHQIRGYVNIAIGNFISSFVRKNHQLVPTADSLQLERDLLTCSITRLLKGLEDESSICVLHTLHAISVCLNLLLQTYEYKYTLTLLEMIFFLTENPYWLIKMKILEIVQEIQYEQLFHVTGERYAFQERIFEKIILVFLGDSDGRVRSAAALTLPKFVKKAYYPFDHQFQSVVTTYAKQHNFESLPSFLREKQNESTMAQQHSLMRVVHRLSSILFSTQCKNVVAGCCEAFANLVSEYPPSTNLLGWQCLNCDTSMTNSYSPLILCEYLLSLLTNSMLIMNFDFHLSALMIISELLTALCKVDMKSKKITVVFMDGAWSFLNDYKLSHLAESFLQHLTRLANIFNDIVTNANVKALAPVKWQKNSLNPLPIDEPLLSRRRVDIGWLNSKQLKRKSNFRREEKHPFSRYNHLVSYMKLREALKSAFMNYEVTLKPESSEKFVTFLRTVLEIFGIVLNFTTTSEIDRICKDLLNYLRNFMVFLPIESIRCVKLLLKSVFGTNLLAEYSQYNKFSDSSTDESDHPEVGEFFKTVFQNPEDKLSQFLNLSEKLRLAREREKSELLSPSAYYAKRSINLNMLPSYIKLVEPNVIQSLRLYTVTSDAQVQAEVLFLLSELIQLKINYCLLDSEQIFIKFVLSQFQLIEEEQLPNMKVLLPAMFDFLIHLANEKHSKPVMTIPKVIQLCDSLIAGIQAVPHCLAAMELVVQHVFLKTSLILDTNEVKELETQRDVLLAMLLKLMHNPRTFLSLILILNHSDEDTKLKRSNQIVENLLNVLEEKKIIEVDPIHTSTSLLRLLFALHSGSYSVERLWRTTLNICYSYRKRRDIVNWLPLFNPFLIFLLSKCDEKQILDTVKKCSSHILFSVNEYNENGSEDPLRVSVLQIMEITPTRAFAKILLDNMKLILGEITGRDSSDLKHELPLLSELTLLTLYIKKSGQFPLINSELSRCEEQRSDSEDDIEIIDQSMRELWMKCPVIVLRWSNLIFDNELLNVDKPSNICGLSDFTSNLEERNLSRDTIKKGLFLKVCHSPYEWMVDVETLRSFLVDNFDMLLTTSKESVVCDFLKHIQEDEKLSRVLIEVTEEQSSKSKQSIKVLKMLECLKYTHKEIALQRLMLYCQLELFKHPCTVITNYVVDSANEIFDHFETLDNEGNLKQLFDPSTYEYILKIFKDSELSSVRLLINRLCRISERWLDRPMLAVSAEDSQLKLTHLQCTRPDKEWFFNLLKYKCCNSNESRYLKMAVMLGRLPPKDAFNLMSSPNFNYKILPYCFLLPYQYLQKWPPDSVEEKYQLSELYLTAKSIVCQSIKSITSLLPKNHQVYEPIKRDSDAEELEYSQSLRSVFMEKKFVDRVRALIPATNAYLQSVTSLRSVVDLHLLIDFEFSSDLANFAVLCLELIHWVIVERCSWTKSETALALECCASILEVDEIQTVISPSHIGSLIFSLYVLLETHSQDSIKFKSNPVFEKIPEEGTHHIRHSVHTVSVVTEYFLTKVPVLPTDVILYRCKMLLITLCRSPLIYDYVRIPLELWKHVGVEDVVTQNCLTLNTISENFLQDCDILQNLVSRLMFYGWNCRTQFEECWMSLLTALNSLPEQDVSEEEQQALSQIYAVTISAVTSLLVQTLYFPVPGRKTCPRVLHVSRNVLRLDQQRWKSKLAIINYKLKQKVKIEDENIFSLFDNFEVNIERLHDKNSYGFNQISVEYLLLSSNSVFSADDNQDVSITYKRRQQSIKKIGIDTNSCVYFLMDFYTRLLMKPSEQPIQTLLEIVNSLIVVSDLFTEVTQFAWLLDSAFDLWTKYSKVDDVVCAFLIVIICKSAAVFVPLEVDSKRFVVRVLKSGLANDNIAVQTASLQGLLYLLERIFKREVMNQTENIDGPFQDEILSAAINYVLENLEVDLIEIHEEKLIYCVISIGFYLIENRIGGENTVLIVDRFIKLSVRACKMKLWKIHTTIMQGVFNLILVGNVTAKKFDNELSQMVKEILSTVECDPTIALLSLQILIATIYSANEFRDTNAQSSDDVFDSEKHIMKIERTTVFFDRIKKCRRVEAKLICSVLPQVLNDLFPPSEILNKVILEFLSPHQKYPDLLAEVVHQVFQNAIQQSQLSLIQDWVLSLLNNFSNCPKSKAVYCLTCFFISACTNSWLTAFLPALQMAYDAEKERESKELLCIAATQFYSELKDDSQKRKFVSTFQAAESKLSDGRFEDILKMILPEKASD